MRRGTLILIIIIMILVICGGCLPFGKEAKTSVISAYKPSDFTEAATPISRENMRHTSSLWFEDNNSNWLYTDHKARNVNDVLTVKILEESVAKSKATTKTSSGSEIGAGISGLFGLERAASRANPDMNLDTLVGAKFQNGFDGKGETTRSGKLVATISAQVVDILPNGNLVIKGKRVVKVNGEEEIITLTGIVRPRDVAADNSVLSTLVADAKIEYMGRGVVADKQSPGFLGRAMDKAWPF